MNGKVQTLTLLLVKTPTRAGKNEKESAADAQINAGHLPHP